MFLGVNRSEPFLTTIMECARSNSFKSEEPRSKIRAMYLYTLKSEKKEGGVVLSDSTAKITVFRNFYE